VQSDAFRALFQEGMELVEETAAYLDGEGREQSRLLSRQGTLIYAGESMRLTTRLMQIASWLLVQRAVAEGEITSDQAQTEKNRVRLHGQSAGPALSDFELLPVRLRELIGLSARLHARILHLDRLISQANPRPLTPDNPVAVQQWLIERAFRDPD
jgi:regulator of CtrA degradation